MKIRRGGMDDVPAIMGMLDGAVAWLADRNRADQWGTRPWSEDPGQVEKIVGKVLTGIAWIAKVDGEPTGAMAHSALLAHAYEEARRAGIVLLRVSCLAGNDGRLVEYYRSNGFTQADTFTTGAWPGQLLFREVTPS